MSANASILDDIRGRFGPESVIPEQPRDGLTTFWTSREKVRDILQYLKTEIVRPYRMLYDLTALDERVRMHRQGQPPSDFTVVYHLLSLAHKQRLRIKLRVDGDDPVVDSITHLWGSANWLEREVWDMFGIRFAGHPNLKRILLYEEFEGHPLRKDYPLRKRQPLIGPKS
jgi:NADH-quinone oxidoreductase subunit C/D